MRRFLITLGFMTRIPVSQKIPFKEGDLEKGIVYFPIIGLLLGGISAAFYQIAMLFFPKSFAVLLAITSNLFLTGAFHLDGLCDTVDGIYSARTKERMLEIMKDSHIGTNGVAALVLDLAFKYIGIYYSPIPVLTILILPVAGKMIQGVMGYRAVYPREKGLGLFVGTVTKGRTIMSYSIGAIILMVGLSMMNWYIGKPAIFSGTGMEYRLLNGGVVGAIFSMILLVAWCTAPNRAPATQGAASGRKYGSESGTAERCPCQTSVRRRLMPGRNPAWQQRRFPMQRR